MYDFKYRHNPFTLQNLMLKTLGVILSSEDNERLSKYKRYWDFFEGFHWEEIPVTDKPQVTVNYCRAFVNKFVAFELGKGFNIKMKADTEKQDDKNDPLEFLEEVWRDNKKSHFCQELGQSKSVTGDSWIQVVWEPKFDTNGKRIPSFIDPFDEYEKGRIRVLVVPTSIAFPVYDNGYDKDKLVSLTIQYPIKKRLESPFQSKEEYLLHRQVYTADRIQVFEGQNDVNLILDIPNPYGVIPFKQVKNLPLQGRNTGISDLDDVIPLNMELNLKKSDVSEVIDYHSAPVTVVYGARITQLERGANKVWGGLPKDSRIENLALNGELTAATSYIASIKTAMHEIAGIPEGALGSSQAISNTSGIALQTILMPLIEKVSAKQAMTKEGLEWINKLILKIGVTHGLISIPEGMKTKDFYFNEVTFESTLPKDSVAELQEAEIEMSLGLNDRESIMKKRGMDNIQQRMQKIDDDIKKNPVFYGQQPPTEGSNSTQNTPIGRANGVNKEGNKMRSNAGYTNSPKPKP